MTQEEIIARVKGIHAEVDHDGVDIIYNDSQYDYDIRFTNYDSLFTIEIYAKDEETPLVLTGATMTELFDYVVDLHFAYVISANELEDTQDYLDIYER